MGLKKIKLNKKLTVKMTEEDKAAIETKARKNGVSVSEWVRYAALNHIYKGSK